MQAKRKYDPCNLYVVEYGVGWDQPKATCGLAGPPQRATRGLLRSSSSSA